MALMTRHVVSINAKYIHRQGQDAFNAMASYSTDGSKSDANGGVGEDEFPSSPRNTAMVDPSRRRGNRRSR
jgi:hypothetical protein